ncbi:MULTISPECIES: hypothetical protein [unclassified Solwaraspora]|uniref:SbtR family transcriptional regulator n=1 Tax=unclassified Solwaraspora TaxID=2627926 RepID=UPI0032B100D8
MTTWLCELAAYNATTRGLVASLLQEPPEDESCCAMLVAAGEPLLRRAVDNGAVRPDVAMADLVTLVNAIALATESASAAEAQRLIASRYARRSGCWPNLARLPPYGQRRLSPQEVGLWRRGCSTS